MHLAGALHLLSLALRLQKRAVAPLEEAQSYSWLVLS
jgi:hypothetical protein